MQTIRSWGLRIPIVLITAYASEEMLNEAFQLGATALLCKPFDLMDLQAAVACLLPGDAARDAAPGTVGHARCGDRARAARTGMMRRGLDHGQPARAGRQHAAVVCVRLCYARVEPQSAGRGRGDSGGGRTGFARSWCRSVMRKLPHAVPGDVMLEGPELASRSTASLRRCAAARWSRSAMEHWRTTGRRCCRTLRSAMSCARSRSSACASRVWASARPS